MGTEKKFKIVSFITYLFVGSLAIIGIIFPVPEVFLDSIPSNIMLLLIIFFTLNSLMIAFYCYYWGKSTGENKKVMERVKQRLSENKVY